MAKDDDDEVLHAVRFDASRRRFAVEWKRLEERHPSRFERCVLPKPPGVWFSIGYAWKKWARENMPRIETLYDVDVFEQRFGVVVRHGEPFPVLIDWRRVVDAYPGNIGVLLLASTIARTMSSDRRMTRSYWMNVWGAAGACVELTDDALKTSDPRCRPLY